MPSGGPYGSTEHGESSYMAEGEREPTRARPSRLRKHLDWFSSWMLPGLGMFSNAYIMLAVGNIHPILVVADPECWSEDGAGTACTAALRDSVRYAVFVGFMIGMIAGGILGDRFGRRKGLITTAFIMLVGTVLMVCSVGPNLQFEYTWYVIALALFGVGVGGEYPLSAVSSAEKAELERQKRLKIAKETGVLPPKQNRGMQVSMAFSMQGLGNWTNTLVIVLLLLAFDQTSKSKYDRHSMEIIWRLQYGLGGLVVLGLLLYRYKYLEESQIWLLSKEQMNREGEGVHVSEIARRRRAEIFHFFKVYWPRLVGTAGGWFVWDLTFYGNKVFQTQFINLFTTNPTIITTLSWALLNSTIAQLGYWSAAATMDRPWMGRRRMQNMGFVILFVVFTLGGILWDTLRQPSHLVALQILYYITTYFGQFGPNATTYVFPSEVYPTDVRALGHALSGAMGKLGALVASVLFSLIDNRTRFIICGVCGAVGFVLTVIFLPEVGPMDLTENDEFWAHERQWLRSNRNGSDKGALAASSAFDRATESPTIPSNSPTEMRGSPARQYDGAFQRYLSRFEHVVSPQNAFSPQALLS